MATHEEERRPTRSLSAQDVPSPRERPLREWFSRFSRRIAQLTGTPWGFAFAALVIVLWAVSGPIFGFSDTWQLVINTGTTIVTFLMVFLIQHTQNKDTTVIHVKLNELIASQPGASNHLIDLEDMSDADLERLRIAFQKLADRADEKGVHGKMSVEEVAHAIEEEHRARGETTRKHQNARRA